MLQVTWGNSNRLWRTIWMATYDSCPTRRRPNSRSSVARSKIAGQRSSFRFRWKYASPLSFPVAQRQMSTLNKADELEWAVVACALRIQTKLPPAGFSARSQPDPTKEHKETRERFSTFPASFALSLFRYALRGTAKLPVPQLPSAPRRPTVNTAVT